VLYRLQLDQEQEGVAVMVEVLHLFSLVGLILVVVELSLLQEEVVLMDSLAVILLLTEGLQVVQRVTLSLQTFKEKLELVQQL
jgi:hypothetical protein